MACKISKRKNVTIDGSTSIFGGALSGLTLNIGSGNQHSSGTITVVKKEKGDLKPPEPFTTVDVGIGDTIYPMVVEGYSMAESPTAADSLKVEVRDKSYEVLDLNVIMLNDADRSGGGIEYAQYSTSTMGVHSLGSRWIPKKTEDMFGNILPVADGQWMKARDYWENKQFLALLGLGKMTPMTPSQLEDRIINEGGDVLYDAQDVFDLLKIKKPDWASGTEKLKFIGTFRAVLESLANYYGFFWWWDMESGEVKVASEIDVDEGNAILSELGDKCRITSRGKTVSAASTYAKAVYSQFDNRWTWTSKGGSNSARGIRYMSATLMGPTFKYRKCHQGEDVKATNLEQMGRSGGRSSSGKVTKAVAVTADQSLAMTAALHGPEVYAAYVIQSLVVNNSRVAIPDVNRDQPVGTEGKAEVFGGAGIDDKDLFICWNCPWTANQFLVDVYKQDPLDKCGTDGKCCCVWPMTLFKKDGDLNAVGDGILSWLTSQEEGVLAEKGLEKHVGASTTPVVFLRKIRGLTGATLFDNGSPTAKDDPTYHYLRALAKFLNRFYVVRRGGGAGQKDYWTAQAGIKRTYNYWVTSTSSPKLAPDSNGTLKSVHPALRLDECGIPAMVDMFKALQYVYTGKNGGVDVADWPPILDFAYWMDSAPASIAAYFSNPSGASFSCTPQTSGSLEGQTNQPKMHFVVLENTIQDIVPDIETAKVPKSFTILDGQMHELNNAFVSNNGLQMYLANQTNLNTEVGIRDLTDEELRLDAPQKIKCMYTTDAAPGQDGTNMEEPYNFYCNWLAIPNLNGKVFSATCEGTKMEATDIGLANGEFGEFGSLIASPFSPENKKIMAEVNRTKAEVQSDYDTSWSGTTRIGFMLVDEDEVAVPGLNEGLQGLSVSVGEQTTVEVTVGNDTLKKVAKNRQMNKLNTAFNAYGSQAFGNSVPQLSNALRFLGISK